MGMVKRFKADAGSDEGAKVSRLWALQIPQGESRSDEGPAGKGMIQAITAGDVPSPNYNGSISDCG